MLFRIFIFKLLKVFLGVFLKFFLKFMNMDMDMLIKINHQPISSHC